MIGVSYGGVFLFSMLIGYGIYWPLTSHQPGVQESSAVNFGTYFQCYLFQ